MFVTDGTDEKGAMCTAPKCICSMAKKVLYKDVTLRCLEQREKSRSIDLLKRGHAVTRSLRHAGGELVLG